jgi:hypothetical protein
MLMSRGVALAVIACVLLAQPAAPAPAAATRSGAVPSGPHTPSHKPSRRLRRPNFIKPGTCDANGTNSFVGVAGSFAGGDDAGVLGGVTNEACDDASGVGAGQDNQIGQNDRAIYSFIGGGFFNGITGRSAFIGAGEGNGAEGLGSFVGAGTFDDVSGAGAFVGAGGETYAGEADSRMSLPTVYSNIASGTDSFVGAGDLNQVSGQGSFIGAGGSAYAASGATAAANQVSGVDSFIGAGDQNSVNEASSFVGAGQLNTINGPGSFIGAGGYLSSTTTGLANYISGTDGFIGAGDANYVSANDAFIGGGLGNRITSGADAAIAGGDGNTASGAYGAVAGGYRNSATGSGAAVGGGSTSSATGAYATIPGGYLNAANGTGSFAAGTQAKARHSGAFVWSDNNGTAEVQSTAAYQFVARASGGFFLLSNAAGTSGVKLNPGSGTWSSLSDRAMKTSVTALDDAAVLAKVAALPVSAWSYTSERGIRHVGPMAQDFYAAFRVGEDDRHITSIDEDGIALAAIKALAKENRSLQAETRALHRENDGLRMENREIHLDDRGLRERLTRQDARLAALEREVAALAAR